MLEAVLALLRRPPPRGRSLLVIGTTAHYSLLARTALLNAFDAKVPVEQSPRAPRSPRRLAAASAGHLSRPSQPLP